MISSSRLRLRAWQEGDVADLVRLRNDIDLQAALLSRVRGSTPEQVRLWLQDRSRSIDGLFFIIADAQSDRVQGYLQFTDCDQIDQRAELGICIAPTAQGQGIGREALSLVLPFLRDTWGARKVVLRVRSDNKSAIRLYENIGFERCGTFREHVFVDGRWYDVILMEKFLHDGAPP